MTFNIIITCTPNLPTLRHHLSLRWLWPFSMGAINFPSPSFSVCWLWEVFSDQHLFSARPCPHTAVSKTSSSSDPRTAFLCAAYFVLSLCYPWPQGSCSPPEKTQSKLYRNNHRVWICWYWKIKNRSLQKHLIKLDFSDEKTNTSGESCQRYKTQHSGCLFLIQHTLFSAVSGGNELYCCPYFI